MKQTQDTPGIKLEEGLIEIKGASMPENVLLFFKPVVEWFKQYVDNPAKFTLIKIYLTYTNSCSIKYICDLVKMLEPAYQKGFDMKLEWHYEDGDESMQDAGLDIESLVTIPFEYIPEEPEFQEKRRLKVQNIKTGKIGEISELYWETIKRNGHQNNFKIISYC